MKNYIKINGKKIELTEEQVTEIQKSFGVGSIKLSDIPAGETFKIGDYEFVVLEHFEDKTAIIFKDLLVEKTRFGENNNYNGSNVDNICNDFAITVANLVGSENLILHTVDLTSDDGLKDYGTIKRRVHPLTTDLYRKYVSILDKYNLKKWQWLVTAYSTHTHEDETWVKCVAPFGFIDIDIYCDSIYGVRPFCILKSNIFVSK